MISVEQSPSVVYIWMYNSSSVLHNVLLFISWFHRAFSRSHFRKLQSLSLLHHLLNSDILYGPLCCKPHLNSFYLWCHMLMILFYAMFSDQIEARDVGIQAEGTNSTGGLSYSHVYTDISILIETDWCIHSFCQLNHWYN